MDWAEFLQELTFDELDIERISELFIHHKGNEEFYHRWNAIYRDHFENYLSKKRGAAIEPHNPKKGVIETRLEEFLALRANAPILNKMKSRTRHSTLYIIF